MGTLPSNVLPPPSGDDVSTLISRVKLQEMLPTSNTTFADNDILQLMDQELRSIIVPMVASVREEYMVVTRDYVLPAIPSGQTTNVKNWIDIPSEASGLRLRDVYYLDQIGQFVNLPRLNPEQIASWSVLPLVSSPGVAWTGGYGGFYLQGNQLMIYPYWSANARPLRITYNRRPAQLNITANSAQILSISGDVVTVSPAIVSWAANTYVDFIKNDTPHDYVQDLSATQALYTSPIPLQAVPILAASGNSYTFDPSIVQSLSVGDWMCTNGYSPFPQFVPPEAIPVLVQLTALRCLEALGDREGQQMAEQKYASMVKAMLSLITPRVEGKTRKVTNPNSLSRNNAAFTMRLRG